MPRREAQEIRAAAKLRQAAAPLKMLGLLALAAVLPACGALMAEGASAGAGIGAASLANSLGAGARGTAAIGLGVQAGARAGVQYAQRQAHLVAQNGIARAAGPLPVGGVARWSVRHSVPMEPNESGEVTVARTFGAGSISCKEIVFSVDSTEDGRPRRAFYTAHICRDGDTWRWASAEPATERWGSLQ
jgi:hypothetical protein